MELGPIAVVTILLFGASELSTLAPSTGPANGGIERGRRWVEAELERVGAGARADEDAAAAEPGADPAGA